MAKKDGVTDRLDELERRANVQEREFVMLANTIKELADHVQQLAAAQVQILDSHDELLGKIVQMDEALNQLRQNQ